jgi:hypothetical protein
MLPLFLAWRGDLPSFGKINYGLYIGDSMENNVKTTMQTIESVYMESEYLYGEFEEAKFTDRKIYLVRKPRTAKEVKAYERHMKKSGAKKEEVPGRKSRVFAMNGYGALTGLKGTRQGLQRPQFAIMDDMVKSDAEANSPVILENIHNTIYSDVLNALHGAKSIAVMIGTPYNKNDPVYKAIETGAWVPVVFPICKTISSNLKKKDFKGVWEDRHSYEAVMKRWRKAVKGNTTNAFMKELMLRISNEEDRMIKEEWIEWFDRGNVIQNAHKYNWYFTSDYTTTGGEDSDFSGAAIWAVNSAGDYMLVDLVLAKMDLAFQYEETFRLINTYKRKVGYLPAGIEIDGQQKVHIFALKQMMQQRGEYFTIAMQKGFNHLGIKSGGIKKIDRLRPMVPMFQHHKIWFANELKGTPQMDELLDELKYLTHTSANSKHDDGLDLISQMNSMPIIIPADDGSSVNKLDSVSQYESHNVYKKYDSDVYKNNDENKSSYIF